MGADQVDCAALSGAGDEPAAEGHGLVGLQAASVQGGAGVVAQAGSVAFEGAADVGANQADRAGLGVADDRCPGQDKHAAGEPFGVQGWLGGVLKLASAQADESQAGIPGEEAFLEEAVFQLEADVRSKALQVKPTGDPGPPKPQPMWVRVGREPSTQDVPDHARPAGPGIAPRPHRGLVNLPIVGGQVEPIPPGDVLDE